MLTLTPMAVPDVLLVEPEVRTDERGHFLESWNARAFAAAGIEGPFVQDNQSESLRSVLRGLHCQLRQAQGKLVRVVEGEVYDVAVDLRATSPTFGRWCATRLSAADRRMMWIPVGFAHGYYTLSARATVLYKVTDYYAPQFERAVRWDDPDLGIDWPLAEAGGPIVSARDAAGVALRAAREWYP